MLSLGAAAFTADGNMLSTFSANLYPMENSNPDPDTARWWLSQPEAWAEVIKDRVEPEKGIRDFAAWVLNQPGKPVFVAYPATFDFMFVYWYLMKYTGHSSFSMVALDMKSFAMAMLGCDFYECRQSIWPKLWFGDDKHSHVAVQDAIEQGRIFCKMLKASKL
jgi:DNA polymerase III alpha subunit (gram-positive type)